MSSCWCPLQRFCWLGDLSFERESKLGFSDLEGRTDRVNRKGVEDLKRVMCGTLFLD